MTLTQPDESRELQHAPQLRFVVAPITHVDVRDNSETAGGDSWTMSGYAAVYNQNTTLYDGKFFKITESIDPAAFDNVLRDQPMGQADGVVHFNHGHDMMSAVAATDVASGQPGSLQLRSDANGLYFMARVAKDDPDGVRLASKMRTGVVRQASFAFTIASAETTETENADGPDEDHQRILEVKQLFDVCACAQGAYPQTVSQLRSYAAAIGQPTAVGVHQPQLDLGEATNGSRDRGAGRSDELAAARARARAHARQAQQRWKAL